MVTAPIPDIMALAILAGSAVSKVPLSSSAGTARSGVESFCVLPLAVRIDTEVRETEIRHVLLAVWLHWQGDERTTVSGGINAAE